jgi:glucose dehydrogenase
MIRRFAEFLSIAFLLMQMISAQAPTSGEWRYYSADNRATKYSPLNQINRDNVTKLKVVWRHPQADPALLAANPDLRLSNRYMATPIMTAGVLYVTNALGMAEAIDPATGKTLWTQKPLVSGPEGSRRAPLRRVWRTGVRVRNPGSLPFVNNTCSLSIRRTENPTRILAMAVRST